MNRPRSLAAITAVCLVLLLLFLPASVFAEETPIPLIGWKWDQRTIKTSWASSCTTEVTMILEAINRWQAAFSYFTYKNGTGDVHFVCKVQGKFAGRVIANPVLGIISSARIEIARMVLSQGISEKRALLSTVMHELGHALGLDHTDNPGDLMYSRGNMITTVSWDDVQSLMILYQTSIPEFGAGPVVSLFLVVLLTSQILLRRSRKSGATPAAKSSIKF